jgi:excisionase family DNA binding protein
MNTAVHTRKSWLPAEPPADWRKRAFLTVQEVMHLTGLERGTVYAALERGGIPGRLKIGNLVRVRVKQFAPWLDGAPPERGAAA